MVPRNENEGKSQVNRSTAKKGSKVIASCYVYEYHCCYSSYHRRYGYGLPSTSYPVCTAVLSALLILLLCQVQVNPFTAV